MLASVHAFDHSHGMGDGDLGAVVWGVVSASASSSSVSGLHSHHTPSMLGASSSSSWDSSVEFGFSQAYDHFQSPARMDLPASGGTALTQGINPDPSAKTGETPPKGSPPPPKKSTDCKQLSRRRKLQQKRTVYVPVGGDGRPSGEILPSDMWAWRKYGQKPIKGSPYPRGYYKCSSSKGCSARKQVERSPTDPSMLIITYTSEHNHSWPAHRNSLAGTIRPKPSLQKSVATFCSDLAASDPPHKFSGSISNANASPSGTNLSSGNTAFLPGDSGNLETVSRFSSQDEEFFLEFNHLPGFSSALRKTFLDDEGGNAEVDPYNLFCWSAGGLPTF